MDRSNIEKIARTPEDKVLLAKVWDKINMGILVIQSHLAVANFVRFKKAR